MVRLPDHRPSLWSERGARDYGMDLTENERYWLDLDERPSLLVPSSGATARRNPAPGSQEDE